MHDDTLTDWYGPERATFGDRLAGAREHLGMDQAELARRLGVKLATLRAWEQDISEPRANKLQMAAGLLNVSLSWLLSGEGDGLDGPPDDMALPSDVEPLLNEMRQIRAEIAQRTDRLARLEKRLRTILRGTGS